MLSKNQAKLIRSLQTKKKRIEHQLFVVEGAKSIREFVQAEKELFLACATEQWLANHPNHGIGQQGTVLATDEKTFRSLSSQQQPEGVLAVFSIANQSIDLQQLSSGLTLMAESINDPGNLGTLVRIADWFGVNNLVCSTDSVDVYNPKAVAATMGSLARVTVGYTNLQDLITNGRQQWPQLGIYGAVLGGDNVYTTTLEQHAWLVLGSESHGISPALRQSIPQSISIPGHGGAESLNVAVAGAVLCAEFNRRHR